MQIVTVTEPLRRSETKEEKEIYACLFVTINKVSTQ